MIRKAYLILIAVVSTISITVTAQQSSDLNERARSGLSGPVKSVRTESAKLYTKGGKLKEGPRRLLETATYLQTGERNEGAVYQLAGSEAAAKSRETYRRDALGNIVETVRRSADGSVESQEFYLYEFDKYGNWIKMVTAVPISSPKGVTFAWPEVTHRKIAYYDDAPPPAQVAEVRQESPLSRVVFTGSDVMKRDTEEPPVAPWEAIAGPVPSAAQPIAERAAAKESEAATATAPTTAPTAEAAPALTAKPAKESSGSILGRLGRSIGRGFKRFFGF